VSLEDVRLAGRRYLDTSKMALLFLGDVKAVRESVEAAGLGATVLLAPDGSIL
jgi:hypothetical protein